MTTHLEQHIAAGELRLFDRKLEGALQMRESEQLIRLELTVVCPSGWEGFSFYFETPEGPDTALSTVLSPQQIGPLGNCALYGLKSDCEDPDVFQVESLFMDWYSQNQHLVISVQDAYVELIEGSKPLKGTPEPGLPFFDTATLKQIEQHQPVATPIATGKPPDVMTEIMKMDDWVESSKPGSTIRAQFQPELAPPPPDQLSDRELQTELRILLAQLARLGIALDWCIHFTPRRAYEYLTGTVLDEETFDEFLPHHTVSHQTTWQDCPECQAEFDLEFNEG
jgi:hypothetical protein